MGYGVTLRTWTMPVHISPGTAVISVDPGLHTGIAVLGPSGGVLAAEGEWDETITYVRDMMRLLADGGHVPVILVEPFTISERTVSNSAAPWSLEAIGAIRWLARRHAIDIDTRQGPVEAKNFATNERLRYQGWYISTPGGHVNDALRHLYLYLVKNNRLNVPEGII